MDHLKEEMFSCSIQLLLNVENGVLTLDDELIRYCFGDVQLKTVSDWKAGKDGPVVDTVACAVTSVTFGMQLHCSGESQISNCYTLLESFPNVGNTVTLTFDCGYGKLNFVNKIIHCGFKGSAFTATMGSRHPFIPNSKKMAHE
eukprot:4410524-Ditylum_brightwellii.AAC.1